MPKAEKSNKSNRKTVYKKFIMVLNKNKGSNIPLDILNGQEIITNEIPNDLAFFFYASITSVNAERSFLSTKTYCWIIADDNFIFENLAVGSVALVAQCKKNIQIVRVNVRSRPIKYNNLKIIRKPLFFFFLPSSAKTVSKASII